MTVISAHTRVCLRFLALYTAAAVIMGCLWHLADTHPVRAAIVSLTFGVVWALVLVRVGPRTWWRNGRVTSWPALIAEMLVYMVSTSAGTTLLLQYDLFAVRACGLVVLAAGALYEWGCADKARAQNDSAT